MTRELSSMEFKKIFLEVDTVYRLDGGLFGKEWDEVRKKQINFLLERPLTFKVLTEKFWGPQMLVNFWTNEWWEAEKKLRNSNRSKQIEELADMSLLLLTLDSFNPKLSLPNHLELLKMIWEDTVGSYCKKLGLDGSDLIPITEKKIKINRIRNPKEAFMLVADEDMQTSKERRDQNWLMLKKKRDKLDGLFVKKKDWWKRWLYVDGQGWVREIK